MTSGEPLYRNLMRFKQDHPEAADCKVNGTIPAWLEGNLFRNGSGKFKIGEDQFQHLFDGMAVIHKFSIENGKVQYQNRLLESKALAKNLGANRIVVSEFGTRAFPDPCKNIFNRYFSHFFKMGVLTDNDCVNIMATGDALYALTETDRITRIDKDTLKTVDRAAYSSYATVNSGTAHPHTEKDGTLYNLGVTYGKQIYNTIFRIPPSQPGKATPLEGTHVLAHIPSRWKMCHGYSHSFAMSENYVIYLEQPLAVNILKLVTSHMRNSTFCKSLEYYKDEKLIFHVVEKKTGKIQSKKFCADAFFVFHQVNCYEDNGHLVLDLCAYENADILEKLYLKSIEEANEIPQSTMKRFVLPLESNKVTLSYTSATAKEGQDGNVDVVPEVFENADFELPTINYTGYNTKKYRYAYGVEVKLSDARLFKSDWETRDLKIFEEKNNRILIEPIFVPNPEGKAEDDGVLLVPAISPEDDSPSRLYILDAKDLSEIATADVPPQIAMPFTFHGLFLPKI